MSQSPQGDVLIKIINDNKFNNIVEIGVWKGKTARTILRANPYTLNTYWAVDRWDLLGVEHGHMGALKREDWDKLYARVCQDTFYFPQLKIFRLSSEEASKLFPDESIDLVFIDASHFYKDVINDIKLWLPKVRKGGILSGHDYGSRRHRGVHVAVDEFFKDKSVITYGQPSLVWEHKKI